MSFLKKNFRRPKDLFGHGWESIRGPLINDLSYDHGKVKIGFDYSCMSEDEHHYIFHFLYWVALNIGKKIFYKKLNGSFPYLVYDGDESWPILLKKNWENKIPKDLDDYTLVDECGFKSCVPQEIIKISPDWHKAFLTLTGHSTEKQDEIVRTELMRLDNLWKNGNRKR